jgi:hypothetical protein
MQEPLLQQALNHLVPLVVTLIAALIASATQALRSKLKSDQARDMLLRLSEQASDVVHELEQTLAGQLRAAAQDGKIDAAEVAGLKAAALANFKAYLGERGQADALKVLGFKDELELEAVLRSKLEAEVAKLRAAVTARAKAAVEGLGK